MYRRIYLAFMLILVYSVGFCQESAGIKKVEKMVSEVVRKAMPATVKIAAFDTLSQTLAVSRFSGVVVSGDGLILTAAHATQPKQVYQIVFPDGRKVLGTGLGRISSGADKPATDVAMIQIIDRGQWPFVEMGYSSEMRKGQPCIGISFPGTFEQQLPNVRLGRIESADIEKGNFQSSSKMEPGDSGGALFDAKARLIGIHSWILPNEQQNFEVPIDLYHTYWDALHIPISYDHLPQANAKEKVPREFIADIIPILDVLPMLKPRDAAKVVGLSSVLYGRTQSFALGTVLRIQRNGKAIQVILSKSSTVGEKILVSFDGKQVTAKIMYRDRQNDLALLSIDENLPEGINIAKDSRGGMLPLGTMLFSPLPGGKAKLGIASTGEIGMLLKYSIGYFGASAGFIDGKVTITDIPKGCPAEGQLLKNDQIIAINGVTLNRPEQYGAELAKYYRNDTIAIDAVRNGQALKLKVRLGVYRGYVHTADGFPEGRSLRSDGFKKVIVQDAAILASECGGPVFDVNGRFIGINIARHSRTSTIIMPAVVIAEFCKDCSNRS